MAKVTVASLTANLAAATTEIERLQRALSDSQDHVKKLKIIINNRYASAGKNKTTAGVEKVRNSVTFAAAMQMCREKGGTAQDYMYDTVQ